MALPSPYKKLPELHNQKCQKRLQFSGMMSMTRKILQDHVQQTEILYHAVINKTN